MAGGCILRGLGSVPATWSPDCGSLSTAAAPGQTPPDYYTSNATKSTFIYNSDMFNSTHAYARCNDLGGSLASWDSITEQYEVEQYFINSGSIMPKKYGKYLFGYNKTSPDASQYTWQVRGLVGCLDGTAIRPAAPGAQQVLHSHRPIACARVHVAGCCLHAGAWHGA